MAEQKLEPFPEPVSAFRGRRLPEPGHPVGYAAILVHYDLAVPLPHRLFAIGTRSVRVENDAWSMFARAYRPPATLAGHLTFALKREGVNLIILKKLFEVIDASGIEACIRQQPSGAYMRRIWFLYEWLMDRKLALDDVSAGAYTHAVDTSLQFAGTGSRSQRHRVWNNLPGSTGFCPLVHRTERLNAFVAKRLDERARKVVGEFQALEAEEVTAIEGIFSRLFMGGDNPDMLSVRR